MAAEVSMLIGELDESSVLFVRSRASSWFRYSANDSITSTSLSSLLSKPASNAVSTMRSQQVSGYLTPRSGRCNSCGFVFVLVCLEEVQLYIRHSVRRRWCVVEKFRDDCPPCAGTVEPIPLLRWVSVVGKDCSTSPAKKNLQFNCCS